MFSLAVILLVLRASGVFGSCNKLSGERIFSEIRELSLLKLTLDTPFNNTNQECGIRLSPILRNIHEWHFSFLGPEDSPYSGGCYHGKIVLPMDYPNKAPSISMISATGRWVPGMEICLSASNYHQETWNPNWSLRTLVLGLRLHMTSQAKEVGSLDASYQRRRDLARRSVEWQCPECGVAHRKLLSLSQLVNVDQSAKEENLGDNNVRIKRQRGSAPDKIHKKDESECRSASARSIRRMLHHCTNRRWLKQPKNKFE